MIESKIAFKLSKKIFTMKNIEGNYHFSTKLTKNEVKIFKVQKHYLVNNNKIQTKNKILFKDFSIMEKDILFYQI